MTAILIDWDEMYCQYCSNSRLVESDVVESKGNLIKKYCGCVRCHAEYIKERKVNGQEEAENESDQ